MTQSIYDKNWFINIVDTRSNDTKQIGIDDTKGRTIRKLIGGAAGEVQKKYSRKGKLDEKKIMHAN